MGVRRSELRRGLSTLRCSGTRTVTCRRVGLQLSSSDKGQAGLSPYVQRQGFRTVGLVFWRGGFCLQEPGAGSTPNPNHQAERCLISDFISYGRQGPPTEMQTKAYSGCRILGGPFDNHRKRGWVGTTRTSQLLRELSTDSACLLGRRRRPPKRVATLRPD